MRTEELTFEAAALIANDLRVLVSQLNERLKVAAEHGLTVDVSTGYSMIGNIHPIVHIRISQEVK